MLINDLTGRRTFGDHASRPGSVRSFQSFVLLLANPLYLSLKITRRGLRGTRGVLLPALPSQFCNAQSNFFEDSLIGVGILAIGVLDVTIFDLGVFIKCQCPGAAAHVDNDIYLFPNFGRDPLGLQTFHPISVSHERLLGHLCHKAYRRQACAERVDCIGSIDACDCLCHRAATGIPYTNEQDPFAAVFAHQDFLSNN
jgi:hypothetical protein